MAREIRRFELGQYTHVGLRVALAVLAALVAVAAFGYGIQGVLNRNNGWQTVESYVDGVDCSDDFTLQYYCGTTAEYKAVCALYTQALEQAYQLFYPEGELDKLNCAPNQTVEVDPVLYRALELVQSTGSRCLYLAPVYVEYDRVFQCENEVEAAGYDPARDEATGAYTAQIAAFANDPAMIDLELLENSRVRLVVAAEYLDFAAENEIEEFLDFAWMKNAFIADYIADTLAEGGYTSGYLASYDGFTRNLDASRSYGFNLFDRQGNEVGLPAVMSYTGPMSIVYLRNYPMSDADRWHYFTFSDGRIATAFVDPADGRDKSAADNLVAYSANVGCGEILLKLSSVYLADTLDEQALWALPEEQIHAVWFDGLVLKHTQADLSLAVTEDGLAAGYRIP